MTASASVLACTRAADMLVLAEDSDAGEKRLLEEFNTRLGALDPDTVEGHNLFKFDLDYLRRLWSGIREHAAAAAPRTLLYQDLDLGLRVLRDFVHEETARILVDSRETCRRMVEFGEVWKLTPPNEWELVAKP